MSQILLVEDSKVQAFVALRFLRDAGFTVAHAETAEDAVQSCYEDAPDLVLLDQHLADVSGLEVCRRLKNDDALTDIPVLVLTASNKDKDHIASLDAGADAFLPKDGPRQELLAVMSRLLESANGVRVPGAGGRRSALGRSRVLVVDDSPTFRDVMCKKLVGAGFETSGVASGAEGLSLLGRQQFDVAVVDVVMPEMNGFEFCSKARQQAGEQNVQLGLLVLTGSDLNDVLVEALEAGADDYVTKLQEFDVILAHTAALARRIARARRIEAVNRQVRERDVVENADRARQQLLASLRNELQAPIDTILATSERLLNTDLTDVQRDDIRSVQQATAAILAVFDNSTDAPQSDQKDAQPEPIAETADEQENDGEQETPGEQETDEEQENEGGVINLEAAQRRVPGGREAVRMVAEMLLVECPKMMQEIRTAVENTDAPLLQCSAHKLKGSASVFEARGVVDAASTLESMGGNGQLTDVGPRLSELEDEILKMTTALQNLVGGP